MDISEVISRVKSYCPSEYSDNEMHEWCEEVSSMIAVEVHDVKRVIDTEITLCDAPYDTMYIDYVMAKICLYQRDMNMYNHHMASFNSKLDAYKRWYMTIPPRRADKLKNWW